MRLTSTQYAAASAFALLMTLPTAFGMGHHAPPPDGSVAAGIRYLSQLENEACHPSYYYRPPRALVNHEGRLIEPLREAAREANPLSSLTLSAKNFAMSRPELGRAYADLAVTGRRAFDAFRKLHAKGELSPGRLVEILDADPFLDWLTPEELLAAAEKALERAYLVANVLPFGNSPDRPDLGWIAVSGEDDSPYRPVNASSSEFPQHEITVTVGGRAVRTRYMIADGLRRPRPAVAPAAGRLVSAPAPALSPDSKVLLYIHGMDSRLEEALDLVQALRKISKESGENWTVISMDMPSSGYADKLDPASIAPVESLGRPKLVGFDARGTQNAPVLDFMESFIVAFVDALDREVPVKNRIHAVLGGSFGGNMTFRLGRRTDIPWLRNVVSWSPASIWSGLADGGDLFKQIGVATAWKRAGGDPARLEENEQARDTFFEEAFGGAVEIGPIKIVPSQPEHWWSRQWPCFDDSLEISRLERQEIYTRNFRLWHWRLAVEQLIYSHQGAPDLDHPRFMDNHVRMLLAAGEHDNFPFTRMFDTTQGTAERMRQTPGEAVFFLGTGHSIHNERPQAFAREIVRFLR